MELLTDCDCYRERLRTIKALGLPGIKIHPDYQGVMIDEIHPERLIVAHLGGWKQWEQVYDHLAGENVWFDTAFSLEYISKELFMRLWEKHDHDKFLFATDSPWGNEEKNIARINQLPLSEKEKEMIFGGNAKKILKLT